LVELGRLLRDWAQSTKRWRDPSAMKTASALPSLLRIKGELLLLQDATGAAAAEDQFRQALDWAHRQGALSWELRTASSLARLWRDQYRVGEVRALLSSVYGRFTESFATGDLRQAKSLLEQLA
jgi:predicted ATPase